MGDETLVGHGRGKYGTGHVALGSNASFGGKLACTLHVDMVYWKPSAWIDGEQVFRDGELLLAQAPAGS